ncbi:putative acetyltransferase (plasmid) [Bosea sp. RAC05]|nr:putative acetyltransferase [Bosea sp. RAC05]
MAHWRETSKPARFFKVDARAGIFVIFTLVHFRVWTVAMTLMIMVLFWFLEMRGMSLVAAFRALRAWIIGDHRPALGRFKVRAKIDFQRRPD